MITAKTLETKLYNQKNFPRADEEAQSIKKLFDLHVRGSCKKQFLRNTLNMPKNLA